MRYGLAILRPELAVQIVPAPPDPWWVPVVTLLIALGKIAVVICMVLVFLASVVLSHVFPPSLMPAIGMITGLVAFNTLRGWL
jgi:hypothetical protein